MVLSQNNYTIDDVLYVMELCTIFRKKRFTCLEYNWNPKTDFVEKCLPPNIVFKYNQKIRINQKYI